MHIDLEDPSSRDPARFSLTFTMPEIEEKVIMGNTNLKGLPYNP